jgi:hypothetical protein
VPPSERCPNCGFKLTGIEQTAQTCVQCQEKKPVQEFRETIGSAGKRYRRKICRTCEKTGVVKKERG